MLSRYLIFLGGGLMTMSILGKGGIMFYRMVKSGNAFSAPSTIGRFYSGGFEKTMTRREAALILGVR